MTSALEGAETQVPLEGRETRLVREIRAIVLDKVPPPVGWKSRYPFVADVVNNTICADLLDYIQRDHLFTGLPLALGDRFMDNFYIAPASLPSIYAEHLILRVTRKGESRIDTISEMLKYLRYRYEITERALYHKTKLAFDAMLGKLLEMWRDACCALNWPRSDFRSSQPSRRVVTTNTSSGGFGTTRETPPTVR